MILKTHVPAFPLNQYVEMMAFYLGYMPDYPLERLMPEGKVEILFALDGIERQVFQAEEQTKPTICKKVWVAGMQQNYLYARADLNSSIFSIKFKTGGSYPFLRLPIIELTNLWVEADLILGLSIYSLQDRMLNTADPMELFGIAEEFLLERLESDRHQQRLIDAVVDRLLNPAVYLKSIAEEMGYSQKQMIQIFKKHVGVTPKSFHRVARFNAALRQVHTAPDVPWQQIIGGCGFYDQAHFINEFKAFSGTTPIDYLHKRGAFHNFIPIFEER